MNFECIVLFNLSFTYHCVTPNNRCNFCAGVLLNIQSFIHSFIQSCKARVLCVLKKNWWDIFTLILRIKKNMLVFDDAIIFAQAYTSIHMQLFPLAQNHTDWLF